MATDNSKMTLDNKISLFYFMYTNDYKGKNAFSDVEDVEIDKFSVHYSVKFWGY
jgi:hypothetical protein